jgi:hypothetical protein
MVEEDEKIGKRKFNLATGKILGERWIEGGS